MSTPPSSADQPARILIVDDHPIVRQGLAQFLAQQPDLEASAEATTVEEAQAFLREQDFDLVILDLSLPGPSGLELIKQLQSEQPDLPILVLSMHDETFYAERVLRAGAAGYIMKQEAISEVIDAARHVLKGEVYVSEAMSNQMLHRFVRGGPADHGSPVAQLSDRELEVFQLIGQGYGTRQVAEALNLSVKTIESYRANIKQKLNLDNANELMQHAVQWVQANTAP